MSEEAILTEYLDELADVIRSKTGKTENIKATNFASEIESIPSKLQSKTQTITSNTTTTIKPDSGYDGLSQVSVTTNVAPINPSTSNGYIKWDGSFNSSNETFSFTLPAAATYGIVCMSFNYDHASQTTDYYNTIEVTTSNCTYAQIGSGSTEQENRHYRGYSWKITKTTAGQTATFSIKVKWNSAWTGGKLGIAQGVAF